TSLVCSGNQLVILNVANSNNNNFENFNALANPGLACVQVDDAEFARKEWTAVDPSTNFSEDCGYDTPGVVHIPDPFFKKILIENHSINTNGDQEIQLSEARS